MRAPAHTPRRGDYVALFFEDKRMGTGWRRVVVISAGPATVRVIEPTTLRIRSMSPRDYAASAPKPIDNPHYTKIARRLRKNRGLFRDYEDAPMTEGYIRQALEALAKRKKEVSHP